MKLFFILFSIALALPQVSLAKPIVVPKGCVLTVDADNGFGGFETIQPKVIESESETRLVFSSKLGMANLFFHDDTATLSIDANADKNLPNFGSVRTSVNPNDISAEFTLGDKHSDRWYLSCSTTNKK